MVNTNNILKSDTVGTETSKVKIPKVLSSKNLEELEGLGFPEEKKRELLRNPNVNLRETDNISRAN